MRWERVERSPGGGGGGGGLEAQEATEGPGKRWGHTCNAIKGGRFLYVFGGYGKDNCQTNQVHVYDTVKQTWSQPNIKGTPPTPRDSHTCTAVGDNLFVFGGTDGMNPLKDLHILDTSSHTWISPSIRGEGPEAREGHGAALVGKRLFIFGGCGKSPETNNELYFSDLYILNTETFVWKQAVTSGTPPSARDSHTCSSWKNKIIVIGGEDGNDNYLSDVHILDADSLIWKELPTLGQLLPPRAGHSTVSFGKNLFVFGGFTEAQHLYDDLYMLDVDTGIWTKVITTSSGPSARFSVAGDSLDPQKNGVLVFIGGCNKSLEALDDMYYLYTGLVRENERRPEKLSLRKQLKLKCQEQSLTPALDKALIKTGISTDMAHPMPVSVFTPPSSQNFPLNQYQFQPTQGKKTFHAKVTEIISDGYTIETVIDGKPLHGIIFSNRPSSFQTGNNNSNRKRAAGDAGGTVLNGDHNGKQKTSRISSQDVVDLRQLDDINEKKSTLDDVQTDAANIHGPVNTVSSGDFEAPKVSANVEPSATSLSLEDNRTHDAPCSISEIPKDGTSATLGEHVTLSINQVDKKPAIEELDRTEITTQEQIGDQSNRND